MLRHSKPILAVVAALGLAACTTTSAAPSAASRAEEKAADEVFYSCISTHAKAMDDGRSDAYTIASVVRSACREQFGRSLAVSARHLSPAAQQSFFRSMQGKDLEYAVKVVLAERRRSK